MRPRRRWWRTAATVTVLGGALGVLAPPVAATVGPRVTVAVYGDSVVEGYTIPDYLRYGLVPALGTELDRLGGFAPGGSGLVPATPFRMRFNRYTVFGGTAPDPAGWVLAGYASHGLDGPSGYSALASAPQASATAPIDSPSVGILFTKFPGSGVFTVTSGASTWTVDARSSGPPTPTEQWLTMPPGARMVTIHGPSSGTLIFDGLLARRPVAPGRIQVELENLGHMGHTLDDDSAPRIAESLTGQHFDVSVFLAEYIYQYSAEYGAAGSGPRFERRYDRALVDHVRRVRAYGGRCLIADSSPVPLPAAVLAGFAAINRREAARLGCAHTGALSQLWTPASAVREGWTLVDGSHPTRAGYARIARALAPAVLGLVRARVRAGAQRSVARGRAVTSAAPRRA